MGSAFTLLAPLGLIALAAWLLPLLLHLRRRNDVRAQWFAAWRWVRPVPRAARRWRIEHWPLLLLRLLLIAALALLLAAPASAPSTRNGTHVLLAPGISPAQALQAGAPRAATWHRWQPGTPQRAVTGDADAVAADAGRAADLRALDAALPPDARLLVVLPSWFDGADAGALTLAHDVQWRVLPSAMPVLPAPATAALRSAARVDAALGDEARYPLAAMQAWPRTAGAPEVVAAAANVALPADADVLLWFVPGAVPAEVQARVAAGAVLLLPSRAHWPATTRGNAPTSLPLWRDAAGMPWLQMTALGRGRVLHFTRPLHADALPELLDAGFAERLRRALAAAPARAWPVQARDLAPRRITAVYAPPLRPWAPWLVLLIAVLFLAERWLATRALRARGAA